MTSFQSFGLDKCFDLGWRQNLLASKNMKYESTVSYLKSSLAAVKQKMLHELHPIESFFERLNSEKQKLNNISQQLLG
jgi:hypothetical protein